ncbi:hypothetical protein GGX14DRAFT_363731, partial [Mycena pura]
NCRTILHGPHSISVIDLGGQGVRDLWRMSAYCEGHAFIFAVDASAPHRTGPAKDELHCMCTQWQCAELPLLVIANKTDLARARWSSMKLHALSMSRSFLGKENRQYSSRWAAHTWLCVRTV